MDETQAPHPVFYETDPVSLQVIISKGKGSNDVICFFLVREQIVMKLFKLAVTSDHPFACSVCCCEVFYESYVQLLSQLPHPSSVLLLLFQVMKTYHMYHTESISAESKLKEAEKQGEKQIGKANDVSTSLLRHDDRQQRRSAVKKMEKMKEKVWL